MSKHPSIDEVRSFWDRNPLFTGEAGSAEASREFFLEHEKIVIEDCFSGRIEDFYFEGVKGKKVLDVGCGPGFWVREFCRRGAETSAVDLTPKAVELTRKSLECFGYQASVQVGNAESLPFADQTFDHVNCQGVIHHTPDTSKCVEEFFRVLKPGGTVCFSVYYRNLLLRSGALFSIVRTLAGIFPVGLRGRGRENMVGLAASPEELVRMYDGRDNPIGKAFTRREVLKMAAPYFETEMTTRHFFPMRAVPIRLPKSVHRLLHRHFGLMIVFRGKKKPKP